MASPPDELIKIIENPEPQIQVIRGDQIRHSKQGETIREISLSSHPSLAATVNTLRALLFGDVSYILRSFEIEYKSHGENWIINLYPHDSLVKQNIKSISVAGINSSIEHYTITEVNGDYSLTKLYENK